MASDLGLSAGILTLLVLRANATTAGLLPVRELHELVERVAMHIGPVPSFNIMDWRKELPVLEHVKVQIEANQNKASAFLMFCVSTMVEILYVYCIFFIQALGFGLTSKYTSVFTNP